MKRFFKLSLVLVITVMMTFFLFGCKKTPKEESLSRVTVDINPSIELLVDEENKVVSVTALNDDGNIIIVGEAIVGKSVEDAVALIINVSSDTGYLVKGEVEASENEIKISVSGDEEAQKELYNKVKAQVEKVTSEENIAAVVQKAEALEKEALEALVKQVEPELTDEELEAMTEQELLKVLEKARLERAMLYSEELEKAYNQAKEYEIKLVEKEETQKVIESMDASYQVYKEYYASLVDSFSQSIKKLEESYYEKLVDPESAYQVQYAKLLNAKAELIAQKEQVVALEEGAEKEAALKILETKEKLYNQVLEATTSLYELVSKTFEFMISQLKQIEERLVSYLDSLPDEIKTALNAKATEIEASCNKAKDDFFAKFEEEHQEEINYYKALMEEQKAALIAENE